MFEAELAEEAEWITECMARLFIHSRLFQCSRFYGDGLSALDKCPGSNHSIVAHIFQFHFLLDLNPEPPKG